MSQMNLFCPVNMLLENQKRLKIISLLYRLFQHIKRGSSTLKALPLKLQQTAFEMHTLKLGRNERIGNFINIYLLLYILSINMPYVVYQVWAKIVYMNCSIH